MIQRASQLRQEGEASGGSAKSAGNVEKVAGAGAGAEQGSAARHGTDQNNVGDGEGGFCQVAACQGRTVGCSQGQKAVEEAVHPGGLATVGDGERSRQSQREKGGYGTRSHGGQVAEAACQGAMADGFRGVPVEAKVATRNRKIGGNGPFFSRAGGQEGAVVADAEAKAAAGGAGGAVANLLQEVEFAQSGEGSGIGLFTAH